MVLIKKQAYLEAKAWLKKVGVESCANQIPGELSGGQNQRVAIARAMIIKPKILFADEPTGSLDSSNSTKVMELFIETAKENGYSRTNHCRLRRPQNYRS